MRSPQIVILEADGWLAKQLRELAGENRWLVQSVRANESALSLAKRQPAVLLVQFEPAEDRPASLQLIADAHRLAPDTPVVAVADVKLPDAERAAWTAALFDLGARFVLLPPLTKPVLEDVISGLMAATIRRVIGEVPPPSTSRSDGGKRREPGNRWLTWPRRVLTRDGECRIAGRGLRPVYRVRRLRGGLSDRLPGDGRGTPVATAPARLRVVQRLRARLRAGGDPASCGF